MKANTQTLEKILKALANERRLRILAQLKSQGRASVGSIAKHIRLSFKATSRHLLVLKNAELIEREQVSTTVCYFIAVPLLPVVRAVLAELK